MLWPDENQRAHRDACELPLATTSLAPTTPNHYGQQATAAPRGRQVRQPIATARSASYVLEPTSTRRCCCSLSVCLGASLPAWTRPAAHGARLCVSRTEGAPERLPPRCCLYSMLSSNHAVTVKRPKDLIMSRTPGTPRSP